MRERARREAELIVAEAHSEARSVMRAGLGERERLLAEVQRIEALLRSALGIVGEAGASAEPPAEQAAVAPTPPGPGPGPKHEESRDVRPLAAAPPQERQEPEPEAAPAGPEPVAEASVEADDDMPGWPPLRKVAQGGADFDWGD
jgi:hypothetical protein